jgi:hypothetical protein
MSKPETFVATKPIFINNVLHFPGETVTVYPTVETDLVAQAEADFGDGLVKPKDFDPASIVPKPVGAYAGPISTTQTAVQTSVGTLPEDVAEEAGIIEEDAKPRGKKTDPLS